MEMRTCSACSTPYQGNFCPHCGQRYLVTPFTFSFVVQQTIQLLDFNRGFFRTLLHSLFRPGELVHSYLKGDTRRYNNPVRFLLTLIALMALLDSVRTSGGKDEITVWIVVPVVVGFTVLTTVFNYFLSRNDWKFTEHIIVSLYFSSAIFIVLSFVTYLFLAAETYELLPYSDELATSITLITLIAFVFRFNLQVFSGRRLHLVFRTLAFLIIVPAVFVGCVFLVRSF